MMSEQSAMQLGDFVMQTIDGAGNLWADKVNEKERLKNIRRANAQRAAETERFSGEGSAGGTEAGHGKEFNYFSYFQPAIQSLVTQAYYQAAIKGGEKLKKWWDERHTANESSHSEIPENQVDIQAGDLVDDITNQSLVLGNEGYQSAGNPRIMTQRTGSTNTSSPTGRTSQSNYSLNNDQFLLNAFGQQVLPLLMGSEAGGAAALALLKKGSKLIPRQK